MNELEKVIRKIDFQFSGTGQHKINAETLINKEDVIRLDI